MKVHRLIDDMFFEHQRALLHFEFEKALTSLEVYESTLIRHMQDEEEVLRPVYAELASLPGAGAAKLFFDDHEKMRGYVESFKEKTARLASEPDIDRALLQLLDREAFYLRLCGHHDKRETEFLYPILEDSLSETEKEMLLSEIDLSVGSSVEAITAV
jgi:hemerythrin-like domain-containing protein